MDESLKTFSWKLAYLSLVCCSLETFWSRFARRVEVTVKVFLPSVFETSIHHQSVGQNWVLYTEPHCRICAFVRFSQILNTLCNFSLFFQPANRRSSSDEPNLRATTQLKWPLSNKRSLIQHTKYYPVKALAVGTSCKRTHPHPVNDRDHFLRWQSDWEFSMMQWSDLCVPCMS